MSLIKKINQLVPRNLKFLFKRFLPRFLIYRHYKNQLFGTIEIETYSPCNLKCPTCPVANNPRPKTTLSEETWRKVINELKDLDFRGTLSPHFYNEPLMDKRIVDLLDYAKTQLPHIKIVIFTNAILLNHEMFEKLDNLVDHFQITIDQLNIKKAVDKLVEQLNERQIAKLNTRTIMKDALSNRGGSIEVEDEDLKPVLQCSFPINNMTIDASGDVHLCCNDFFGSVKYGNIIHDSLSTIWFSKRFINDGVDILRGRFKYKICKCCKSTDRFK
ncbi:MAG: radical SAM protein [Bacteriovoracaceae bacterium]|nr:radical SAM protein [Bacteriovoracaceae bacterium]